MLNVDDLNICNDGNTGSEGSVAFSLKDNDAEDILCLPCVLHLFKGQSLGGSF
jgi:hypothetical protein